MAGSCHVKTTAAKTNSWPSRCFLCEALPVWVFIIQTIIIEEEKCKVVYFSSTAAPRYQVNLNCGSASTPSLCLVYALIKKIKELLRSNRVMCVTSNTWIWMIFFSLTLSTVSTTDGKSSSKLFREFYLSTSVTSQSCFYCNKTERSSASSSSNHCKWTTNICK